MQIETIRDYLLYIETSVDRQKIPQKEKHLMKEALKRAFLDGVKIGRCEKVTIKRDTN